MSAYERSVDMMIFRHLPVKNQELTKRKEPLELWQRQIDRLTDRYTVGNAKSSGGTKRTYNRRVLLFPFFPSDEDIRPLQRNPLLWVNRWSFSFVSSKFLWLSDARLDPGRSSGRFWVIVRFSCIRGDKSSSPDRKGKNQQEISKAKPGGGRREIIYIWHCYPLSSNGITMACYITKPTYHAIKHPPFYPPYGCFLSVLDVYISISLNIIWISSLYFLSVVQFVCTR